MADTGTSCTTGFRLGLHTGGGGDRHSPSARDFCSESSRVAVIQLIERGGLTQLVNASLSEREGVERRMHKLKARSNGLGKVNAE